jgi:hypothetical protein
MTMRTGREGKASACAAYAAGTVAASGAAKSNERARDDKVKPVPCVIFESSSKA